jgi:hypothetical protein
MVAPHPAMDLSSWTSALRIQRLLWAAMLASTFIYAALVVFVLVPSEEDPSLLWVLSAIAMAGAIASLVLPASMGRAAPRLEVAVREEVDPAAQSMFRDAVPRRRVVTDPAGVRGRYIARRQTLFILELALSEIPAIMGLMVWIVSGGPLSVSLALVALGAASMLARFPAAARWRRDAEAEVGALIPD